MRVRYSVSQFTLGTPMKNLSFLHTKKRPLWFHVSPLTHFNQPLTINNIAELTRAYFYPLKFFHLFGFPGWKSSDPKIIEIETYLFENFSQKIGYRKF